ncbi:MAG: hypothetical protein AAF431_07565 [Pseudomonadota bacterium]
MIRLSLFCTLFVLASCISSSKFQTHGITGENNLFVFIGKKISFRKATKEEYIRNRFRDYMYIATYEVIKPIHGSFERDIITFMVFDHHGQPWMSDFEHAIIPVSEYIEGIVHSKYLFYDVYPTSDGGWATCGTSTKQVEELQDLGLVEDIDFSPELEVPYPNYEGFVAEEEFPIMFYELKKGFASCHRGVTFQNLFDFMKENVLTARGYFEENT